MKREMATQAGHLFIIPGSSRHAGRVIRISDMANTVAPSTAPAAPAQARPVRLGVVSFVNTLPLIDGLEQLPDLALRFSVPSLLMDQLLAGDVELALCSSIDYQRSPEPLVIVPVGLLGCNGPTLTVRLYSTRPINEIEHVYCDTDSHTSIALLRILLKEIYDIEPEMLDYNAREHVAQNKPLDWPEAMLLIGDKVVTDSPPAVRYPHQLDLGALWREHTGMPFVFAAWMARQSADRDRIRTAAAILDRQRRHNIERIDSIIHHRARARNWPVDLANEYLKQRLTYEMTDDRLEALELFFDKALEYRLIDARRPIEVLRG
jgi:chorismate dehydratase